MATRGVAEPGGPQPVGARGARGRQVSELDPVGRHDSSGLREEPVAGDLGTGAVGGAGEQVLTRAQVDPGAPAGGRGVDEHAARQVDGHRGRRSFAGGRSSRPPLRQAAGSRARSAVPLPRAPGSPTFDLCDVDRYAGMDIHL